MRRRPDRYRTSEPVSHRVMADARNRALWDLVARQPGPPPRRLIDLGCGTTRPLQEFVAAVPGGGDRLQVVGIDQIRASLEAGAGASRPPVLVADATAVPLADASADLVTCFTLFSSLPTPAVRRAAAEEILRVLVPGGLVAWYDLRVPSPRNPSITAMPIRRVRELFPTCTLDARSVSVFPPLARRLVPWRPRIYPTLVRLPFLRTHWAAVLRTPG